MLNEPAESISLFIFKKPLSEFKTAERVNDYKTLPAVSNPGGGLVV